MRVASLIGAGDYHIGIISCDIRKHLVKIEIIADKKAVAHTVYFYNSRLGILKGVILIKLIGVSGTFNQSSNYWCSANGKKEDYCKTDVSH